MNRNQKTGGGREGGRRGGGDGGGFGGEVGMVGMVGMWYLDGFPAPRELEEVTRRDSSGILRAL